ncbi:MAG TPA: Fe-S oxidoreductase, partial [Chitinophaga sp.]
MHIVQALVFLLVFAVAVFLFARKARQIRRNILLGRDTALRDHPARRWRNVLLLALGQKKMFRKPLVAVLHFFVYAGFIIINLEILEIVLDGLLARHRLFVPVLGGLYPWLIGAFEVLAVLVIIGCAVFLIRRNLLKIPRFRGHDLDGWPRSDANYILLTEIVLMTLFLTMNTADQVLQTRGLEHYAATGPFLVSGGFTPVFAGLSTPALVAIERSAWWLHILGVLAFLNYLPYSKHLHIILSFPNS